MAFCFVRGVEVPLLLIVVCFNFFQTGTPVQFCVLSVLLLLQVLAILRAVLYLQ